MNKITTLGIDLAKNVFQLHGVDAAGKVVLRREVRRAQLMKTIAQLEPCLIGIEACGGAHIGRGEPRSYVAQANKTARIAWAIMTKGEVYKVPTARPETSIAVAA